MSYNSLFGYGSHSPDANLKHHWTCQETTGASIVDRISALNLTTAGMGADPVTRTGPNSWLPSALDFNGSNQFATSSGNVASAADLTVGAIAFCDVYNNVLRILDVDYLNSFWLGTGNGSPEYGGGCRRGSSPFGAFASGTTAAWQHVSITYVGSTGVTSGFVNSVVGTTTTGSSGSTSAASIRMGALSGSPVNHWNGAVATAYIFDRVLSTGEMSEINSGPEPLNTVVPTLTIDATTWTGTVGTWDAQSNGSVTYAWELRDASDDSVVESGTGSSPSGSGSYSGTYYLWVRASNSGGFDTAEDSVSTDETAAPDTTAPELDTQVLTGATTLVLGFDEPVTFTDQTGMSVSASGGAVTITGISGDGTNTVTLTLSRSMASTESLSFSFDSGTGDVEDLAGNALATISNRLVTNNVSATPGSVSLIGPGLIQ